MFDGRSGAFTSFLDLISCAFGSAILIFLVSVTTGGRSHEHSTAADVMLIRCRHHDPQATDPLEVHFILTEPNGRVVKTTSELPLGYSKFIANAKERPASFVIIPKPVPGEWRIEAYWANEFLARDRNSVVILEVLCPRILAGNLVQTTIEFSSTKRFSEEINFEILPQPRHEQSS